MKKSISNFILAVVFLALASCTNSKEKKGIADTYPDVKVVGAMKDAMWKGDLQSKINLDTIRNKNGLYGLGPQTELTGELLILDGISYVSQVISDTTMTVRKTYKTGAPFFVYGNVTIWDTLTVPKTVADMNALESFIDEKTKSIKRPFAFKISGKVDRATIHVQNLPPGSEVSSPQEAHVGQVDYNLKDEEVDIVGFFSREHQTIFTHHDSYMHLHLITRNRHRMGHLDHANFNNIILYLPKE